MERQRDGYYDRERPLPVKVSSIPRPGGSSRPRGTAPRDMHGRPSGVGDHPPASGANRQPLGGGGNWRPQERLQAMHANYRGRTMTKASGSHRPPTKMRTRAAGTRFPPRLAGRRGAVKSGNTFIQHNDEDDTFTATGQFRLPAKNPAKRRFDDYDIGLRSAPRMMASSSATKGRPQIETSSHAPDIHHVKAARKEGFYVRNGKIYPTKSFKSGSENASSSSDNLSVSRRSLPQTTSQARKQVSLKSTTARGHSTAAENHLEATEPTRRDTIEITDDGAVDGNERRTDDISHLLSALSALNLKERRLREYHRLPFLSRNIRKGFLGRCRLAGVQVTLRVPPIAAVEVVYRYLPEDNNSDISDDDSSSNSSYIRVYEEKRTTMSTWLCPLCAVHGELPTREALQFHLENDHGDVDVDWTQSDDKQKSSWRVLLTIPPPGADHGSEIDEDDLNDDDSEDEAPPEDPQLISDDSDFVVEISPPPRSSLSEVEEEVSTSARNNRLRSSSPASPPIAIKHKFREPSPPLISFQKVPAETVRPESYRGSLPVRYPSPPPPSNPHGPAAQYPFLYAIEKEEETLYSCRPGGPRIYDLLNTLPLEPFGVLSWMIVDREEELYELEDVSDEDKSMLALWNRWIFLNRVKFVFEGYANGVRDFIDEYWRMIHLAAGWGALRAFLLMLTTNRYLTIPEVARLLKYYEEKTGMHLWYQDDTNVLE